MTTAVKGFALHAGDQRRHARSTTPTRSGCGSAIESVRAQIYPHWELCLVNDGSTTPHVRAILDEYVAAEPRIRVEHLSRNQGIAGASTHALRPGDAATSSRSSTTTTSCRPRPCSRWPRGSTQDPDLDLIYTDEDKLEPDGRRVEPFFKPDWSPDLLLSMNYITHLSVFRRSLLDEIGGFRLGLDGSQDYDLLLRFTERTQRIAHIPKMLYHWRKIPGSVAASHGGQAVRLRGRAPGHRGRGPPAGLRGAGRRCTCRDSTRCATARANAARLHHHPDAGPVVAAPAVPAQHRGEDAATPATRSSSSTTTAAEPETLQGLDAVAGKWRVLHCPGPFNFSALNNFGARPGRGDYLLFLNNDTQVVEPDWLTAMLEHAQRPGGRRGGRAPALSRRPHPARRPRPRHRRCGRPRLQGACPATPSRYFALGQRGAQRERGDRGVHDGAAPGLRGGPGLRRAVSQVALNDVDLCLRLRQRGYLIVYTPARPALPPRVGHARTAASARGRGAGVDASGAT